MEVLFCLRHAGFVRNFESLLAALLERGHRVHLAFEVPRERAELVERLAARHPGLTWGPGPLRDDRWTALARWLRTTIDYLRYLEPAYGGAPKLRARARGQAPPALAGLADRLGPRGRRAFARALRAADRALPPARALDALLAERRPDVVLVTPLVAGPEQADVVRAARRARIPCALPVTSWDNLTNKGLIRDAPDAVYVWNEAQRDEAVRLHGVDPERVVAVGAHSYDHWFAWSPSTDREAFAERLGFDPAAPIVLYLCSSKFIAAYEPPFVERWLDALRARGGAPAAANVLIRPHPASGHHWAASPLADRERVAIWPPVGENPIAEEGKAAYYDSIAHSAAVVGLNTSAIVESAIVGRPAFTVLDPEFAGSQEGTLHFHHLLRANGGPLTVGRTMGEHLDQLEAALAPGAAADGWNEPFVRSFVRPHGLEAPATLRLVAEVEALAARPVPAPARSSPVAPVLRVALVPLAALASWHARNGKALRKRAKRLRVAIRGAR